MKTGRYLLLTGLGIMISCSQQSGGKMIVISETVINRTTEDLVQKHGSDPDIKNRIGIGVRQTASFWRKSDGSADDFRTFCLDHFITDPEMLGRTVERFENNLESIDGHFLEITRNLMEPMDLEPMLPVDYQFAEYSPWTHLTDDLFGTGPAFTALLNFRIYSLEERLRLGPAWQRQDWARARLAERFSARVPAEVRQSLNTAYVRAEDYIASYNIWMHHVLTWDGRRLFPQNLKLISHWGLRDELRGRYADPGGEERQELIRLIMEKIIRQEIPQAVIDNPDVDWQLTDNTVSVTTVESGREKPVDVTAGREPDTRYRHLLNVFQAERLADPWYPTLPTKIDRRFKRDREIPEEKVEALFVSLLSSDEFKQTGRLVSERLGRPLKPFDIWYNGFKAAGAYPEAELDRIVSRKYPDIQSFQDDIPGMLRTLGFDRKTAEFIGSKIVVDPARGAGHAMGAQRRADNAHLRTRVPSAGMNYKGYNIACHELGHNVEQVLSLNKVDHTLLSGVPNTAFTEAFAFIFQARDLELLGLKPGNGKQDALRILNRFWSACEIAGVSLVDMRVWRWMYAHPKAGPEELREAVIRIAKEVWNAYFAPVFGEENVILLAVYSHMINGGMYLPDYPLGYIIAHQIESYLQDKNLGREMERMCVLGAITPDAWMQEAVGHPISTRPMLEDVGSVLKTIK